VVQGYCLELAWKMDHSSASVKPSLPARTAAVAPTALVASLQRRSVPVVFTPCPLGQQLVLACIKYTNVSITDVTNGITRTIPGTFSRTFFAIPECATF
jgi:hypothetical protein